MVGSTYGRLQKIKQENLMFRQKTKQKQQLKTRGSVG
jgi:hypothetical protein